MDVGKAFDKIQHIFVIKSLPCQSSCFDIRAHSGSPKQNFQPNYIFSLGSFIPQG